MHEAGGLLFQSHPFRDREYIRTPGPIDRLDELDGVEAYNAANYPEENERAAKLAAERGLKCTAGSDGHYFGACGRAGIATRVRPKDATELVELMKKGEYTLYKGEEK